MNIWLRRARGALSMGLTWAITGFVAGMGIEVIHNIWPNPIGGAVDIWPMVLALPGLLGGVAFSVVLGIAGRRRRFDELSLPVIAAWGAVGGLLVSLFPAAMVAIGLATPNIPIWQITLALLGPFTVGGALAAAGSLVLARRAEGKALQRGERQLQDLGLTDADKRELLGDGK